VNDRFFLGPTQRSEASVENIGNSDRSLMVPEPLEPPVRNEDFDVAGALGEVLNYERTNELFPEYLVTPSQALAPQSSS
jgi:hypothetical protein